MILNQVLRKGGMECEKYEPKSAESAVPTSPKRVQAEARAMQRPGGSMPGGLGMRSTKTWY